MDLGNIVSEINKTQMKNTAYETSRLAKILKIESRLEVTKDYRLGGVTTYCFADLLSEVIEKFQN